MYKRGLIALKQQKMQDQKKKNERKSDIRRTGVVVCLFFGRLGWGGQEITSARGDALLSPPRPTSSFRPFVLCPPYRSHFYPSRSSSAVNVEHGDCRLSVCSMLWWMKAMLESEKKLFCHFIGEIRTVPFENPLTREYK